MIVCAETKVFDLLRKKLPRGGVPVKIFQKKLKSSAEGLKIIKLKTRSGGYIWVPMGVLMVLDVNRDNWPHSGKSELPGAPEFHPVLYNPRFEV